MKVSNLTRSRDRREASRDTRIAIGLALIALIASLLMAWFITERVPHLEDEMAYLFQARVFARGALYAPPPPMPNAFFVPFVVTVNEHRIGKYPIGWPMLLAAGERFGAGWLVNPILNALTVLLIFRIARLLYDRQVAVIAAALAISSPFALIQSATYLSHTPAAFWVAVMLWTLLRSERAASPTYWYALLGAALGILLITRPYTGMAVAAAFACVLLVRAGQYSAGKLLGLTQLWPILVTAATVALLQPLYLYLVTGDPFTNLYTKVWSYDRIGFGPDVGRSGHTLLNGLSNAYHDIVYGWVSDLYGWLWLCWIPVLGGLMLGMLDARREHRHWPLLFGAIFTSLVIFHLAYWTGGTNLGPRYYYEAHAGLAVLAAYGLRSAFHILFNDMSGFLEPYSSQKTHPMQGISSLIGLVVVALIAANLFGYLPHRLQDWYGQYTITREPADRVVALFGNRPTLIIVRGQRWREHGMLSHLNSPWYDGHIIVARCRDQDDCDAISNLFPDREVWFYHRGHFSQVQRAESATNEASWSMVHLFGYSPYTSFLKYKKVSPPSSHSKAISIPVWIIVYDTGSNSGISMQMNEKMVITIATPIMSRPAYALVGYHISGFSIMRRVLINPQ